MLQIMLLLIDNYSEESRFLEPVWDQQIKNGSKYPGGGGVMSVI